MKAKYVKDEEQDMAQDVAQDMAQDVAHDAPGATEDGSAMGAYLAHRHLPPTPNTRVPPPRACS